MRVLLLLLFAPILALAQAFYVCTSNDRIYEIYQGSVGYNFLPVAQLGGLEGNALGDIAISPTGDMYGITNTSIIKIDPDAETFEEVVDLSILLNNGLHPSLVCTDQFELIFVDNTNHKLLKYDITTDSLHEIANGPEFYTPGDVSLYRGNVIFPNYPYLKAYNLTTGELTNIACLPEIGGGIWGMAVDYLSCEEGQIIATNSENEVMVFDLQADTITTFQMPMVFFQLFGLASVNEHLYSSCSHVFEEVDCIVNTTGTKEIELDIYPNPTSGALFLTTTETALEVCIYDIKGVIVMPTREVRDQVDISQLPAGLYLVRIAAEEGLVASKLISKL